MNPEQLRQYMEKNKESTYLIVDVRQPEEYVQGHIPGAKLVPLRELLADISGLPVDKDLVFYCHSGGRSAAAATLVSEEGVFEKNIFDLEGGIMAWDGRTVPDYPRVQIFDKSTNLSDLSLTAMDLEKGALRFYDHLKGRVDSTTLSKVFEQLSAAERAHAKAVFSYWKKAVDDPSDFAKIFDALPGEILEGGETLADVLQRVEDMKDNPCLRLIELALHIENAALDLYRTMAEKSESPEAKEVFLSIAQAEKKHMKTLVGVIGECKN